MLKGIVGVVPALAGSGSDPEGGLVGFSGLIDGVGDISSNVDFEMLSSAVECWEEC